MKPGPIIAMLTILGLSLWIMLYTDHSSKADPQAAQIELVIANTKIKVEQKPDAAHQGHYIYHFRNWEEKGTDWKDEAAYQKIIMESADTKDRPLLLRAWNVSSYGNLAWVALGLGGQLIFSGRMLVQWLASEKNRKVVIPPIFWYLSLCGGLCLTAYFVWRHDLVAVLGQSMGLVVYVRNIRLLFVHRAESSPAAAPAVSG